MCSAVLLYQLYFPNCLVLPCTYFKDVEVCGICIYNGTLEILIFEISKTLSW